MNMLGVKLQKNSISFLLTLYGKAYESKTINPILKDIEAERIVEELNETLKNTEEKLLRRLVDGKIRKDLAIHLAIRAKKYDEYAVEFLERNPEGIIVNLGCGLDSRYHRISGVAKCFYDLDLPEVIEIKKMLVKENENYHMIESSIFDEEWIIALKNMEKPVLLLAEGLFMYLPEFDIKKLFGLIGRNLDTTEIVFETVDKSYTKGMKKKLVEFKLHRELGLEKGTTYNFGIEYPNELELWSSNIEFVEEWSYFDSNEKKLGWQRFLGKFKKLRRLQYSVKYIVK